MSFVALIVNNVLARKVRGALTAAAVAVGVMTVVTLGVVTHSLRTTAVAVLRTGKADFTIAQKGSSDLLYSVIDAAELSRIKAHPEVESAVGVLVATTRLNAENPLFLEIGIPPDQLAEFGVRVVGGRPFGATASDEVMLGWRAARSFGKQVGDTMTIESSQYRIVGIYTTGQVFGDSGSMLPLAPLQAYERKPEDMTLGFVRVKPGTNVTALRKAIERENPELATVRSETEFGRVDRNLQLITAADRGATIVALLIGAVIVMNTMLLSFFERTREFGVLRAVGWSRTRVVVLVIGEALLIGLVGAAGGVAFSYIGTRVLERLPSLVGLLHPEYSAGIFLRALYTAAGMAFIGALYPAARAALLAPLEALRRE